MAVAGGSGARAPAGDAGGSWLFRASALLALALHLWLLLSAGGLTGGADLVPHLRLIAWMRESPDLRSVYAPAYHVVGALVSPLVGLAAYPRVFAFASAAALILAFRYFQRGAGLPDAAAAVFALSPYALTLSWCIPKVEFAGHALGLLGLGLLVRRRYAGVALATAAAFAVHTAAALVFGLGAGALALASRDLRGLAALAAGTVAALPLVAAHVAAGCSLPEALLFSGSGYLGQLRPPLLPDGLHWIAGLAGPPALVAAALGAGETWRAHRAVSFLCLALLLVYLSNFWLAPFGLRTAVGLHRGLSVLAIPVAISAGVLLGGRRSWRRPGVAACALWAVLAAAVLVPGACFVRRIELAEIRGLQVERCTFRWQGPNLKRSRRPARAAPALAPRREGQLPASP